MNNPTYKNIESSNLSTGEKFTTLSHIEMGEDGKETYVLDPIVVKLPTGDDNELVIGEDNQQVIEEDVDYEKANLEQGILSASSDGIKDIKINLLNNQNIEETKNKVEGLANSLGYTFSLFPQANADAKGVEYGETQRPTVSSIFLSQRNDSTYSQKVDDLGKIIDEYDDPDDFVRSVRFNDLTDYQFSEFEKIASLYGERRKARQDIESANTIETPEQLYDNPNAHAIPEESSPKDKVFEETHRNIDFLDPSDALANFFIVFPDFTSSVPISLFGSANSIFGNRSLNQQMESTSTDIKNKITDIFKKETGLNVVHQSKFNRWYIKQDNGETVDVTPGILSELKANKYAVGLGVAGAVVGIGLGLTAPGLILRKAAGVLSKKSLVAFGTGTAGSVFLSATGNQIDYTSAAMKLSQDLDTTTRFNNMFKTVADTLFWDTVGGLAISGLSKVLPIIFNKINSGSISSSEAVRLAGELSSLSDIERTRLLKVFSEQTGEKIGKTESDVTAMVLSSDNNTSVIRSLVKGAIFSIDPGKAVNLSLTRDKASRAILNAVQKNVSGNLGSIVTSDIVDYTSNIAKMYGNMIKRVNQSPLLNNVKVDRIKVIKPFLNSYEISTNIKYQNIINGSLRSNDRLNLSDLLTLRRKVTDFRYSSLPNDNSLETRTLKNALDSIVKSADKKIEEIAPAVLPDGKSWLKDYELSKKEYTYMKKVFEQEVLYKTMFDSSGKLKPGISPQRIVKSMMNANNANSARWLAILDKLNPADRKTYETAIVDNIVTSNLSTSGVTKFKTIGSQLRKFTFKNQDVVNMVSHISDLSTILSDNIASMSVSAAGRDVGSLAANLETFAERYFFFFGKELINRHISFTGAKKIVGSLQKMLNSPITFKSSKELEKLAATNPPLSKVIADLNKYMIDNGLEVPTISVYKNGTTTGFGSSKKVPLNSIADLSFVEKVKQLVAYNPAIVDRYKEIEVNRILSEEHNFRWKMTSERTVKSIGDGDKYALDEGFFNEKIKKTVETIAGF